MGNVAEALTPTNVVIAAAVGLGLFTLYRQSNKNENQQCDNQYRRSESQFQQSSSHVNECVLCTKMVEFYDLHRLNCNHYLHDDCYEALIREGSRLCPLCRKPFNNRRYQ